MRANQRITVEVKDAEPPVRYQSRIENVTAEHIVLAAPLQGGVPVPLRVGTALRVTLFHAGGAHAFDTTIVGRQAEPTPVLQVERPTRMMALQRRQFFREPAVVKTLCMTTSEQALQIECVTRNIGGGGLCCRTRDVNMLRHIRQQMSEDEPLWVELHLPGRPLQCLAELAWCHFEGDDYADLAFEFVDLPESERERLIRYLFVLQREALRKGVS